MVRTGAREAGRIFGESRAKRAGELQTLPTLPPYFSSPISPDHLFFVYMSCGEEYGHGENNQMKREYILSYLTVKSVKECTLFLQLRERKEKHSDQSLGQKT